MEWATSQSALSIPQIIATLDPEKQTKSNLDTILTTLTAGLAFLSLPAVGALVPATTSAIGTVLVTALQQAPGVAQAIFQTPDDDATTQIVQMGDLASALGTLNSRLGAMLDAGLSTIMHDVSAFTAFASGGSFSGAETLSIPRETAQLDLAFKTYLVASAMAANEWTVFWGPPDDATPTAADPSGTWFNSTLASNARRFICNTAPRDGICDLIDSRGVIPLCQPEDWGTYTSPYTHRAYYPSQGGGRNDPPSARLLHALADNGWGTLDAIFDGGYNCTLAANEDDGGGGGGGGGQPLLRFAPGGKGIDFSCLAGRLRMETGCRE
ncbi:MAG: hypothetical protein LQ352_007963, partial [Teloschistes flavicans]